MIRTGKSPIMVLQVVLFQSCRREMEMGVFIQKLATRGARLW